MCEINILQSANGTVLPYRRPILSENRVQIKIKRKKNKKSQFFIFQRTYFKALFKKIIDI